MKGVIKLLRFRIAALIAGGKVYRFEGLNRTHRWVSGLVILSPEALEAHRAAFRAGAKVYSDTALTEP